MIKLTAEDARFYTNYVDECRIVEKKIIQAAKEGNDHVSVQVNIVYYTNLITELREKNFQVGFINNGKKKEITLNIAW